MHDYFWLDNNLLLAAHSQFHELLLHYSTKKTIRYRVKPGMQAEIQSILTLQDASVKSPALYSRFQGGRSRFSVDGVVSYFKKTKTTLLTAAPLRV